MAVHAHPDDESSSTGGVLAMYGDEGIRTIVVTCTNGELGDAPGGVKPGDAADDEAAVAAIRLAELDEACEILGVRVLEKLGYQDSGMVEWEYKGSSAGVLQRADRGELGAPCDPDGALSAAGRHHLRRVRRLRPSGSRPGSRWRPSNAPASRRSSISPLGDGATSSGCAR